MARFIAAQDGCIIIFSQPEIAERDDPRSQIKEA